MRIRTEYVYLILVAALATAFGICVGPYWVADAWVFALVSCAVVYIGLKGCGSLGDLLSFSFRIAKRPSSDPAFSTPSDYKDYIPRSRIAHYVRVSRIGPAASVARGADNPFEQTLLKVKGWQTLSKEELKRISRSAIEA